MRRTARNAVVVALTGVSALVTGCGGDGPPTTVPPPALTRDCIRHDPANLEIVDLGAAGWRLQDGAMWMVIVDNRNDAEQVLALARQSSAECFIGRDNTRPNRGTYIVEAWTVNQPPLDPLPHPEDCIRYNRNNLTITDQGAAGWRLQEGSMWMLMLDNRTDADEALALARRFDQQCFIGRDNTRPNRSDYIVQYWR